MIIKVYVNQSSITKDKFVKYCVIIKRIRWHAYELL